MIYYYISLIYQDLAPSSQVTGELCTVSRYTCVGLHVQEMAQYFYTQVLRFIKQGEQESNKYNGRRRSTFKLWADKQAHKKKAIHDRISGPAEIKLKRDHA